MKQDNFERRRFGWGAALGFVLVIAGATLLIMVFMTVALGSAWTPVARGATGVPPTLMHRWAPSLAPAPSRVAIVLPTPLPDELFSAVTLAKQSGFSAQNELSEPGSLALLPESPADPGSALGRQAALPATNSPGADSTRLVISTIGLDAPIQPVGLIELEEDGRRFNQWQVPSDYAIGWHRSSAAPGSAGNTVLNGHNNIYGAVFRDLVDLELGDEIIVYEGQQTHHYQVAQREVLEEKNQPLNVRLDNAKWMLPTSDERLTLITCWPYSSSTHRVIVVATPVEGSG